MLLNIPIADFYALMQQQPEIQEVMDFGKATGICEAAGVIYSAMKSGDVTVEKFYLDRVGGGHWAPRSATPALQIIAQPMAVIDEEGMRRRWERQRALLDGRTIDPNTGDVVDIVPAVSGTAGK